MELTHVVYEVSALIRISLADIIVLESLAVNHYDATCNRAALHGGFIRGMLNMETNATGSLHSLSERQIQLLIKLTECNTGLVDLTALTKIRNSLWSILGALHTASQVANNTTGNLNTQKETLC